MFAPPTAIYTHGPGLRRAVYWIRPAQSVDTHKSEKLVPIYIPDFPFGVLTFEKLLLNPFCNKTIQFTIKNGFYIFNRTI